MVSAVGTQISRTIVGALGGKPERVEPIAPPEVGWRKKKQQEESKRKRRLENWLKRNQQKQEDD